jgi:hypothetical protein
LVPRLEHEMALDLQALMNIIGALILAIGGWFSRQIWDAVQRLTHDLHALEVELPKTYVRKEEFTVGIAEIKNLLIRIDEKLDGKMDK